MKKVKPGGKRHPNHCRGNKEKGGKGTDCSASRIKMGENSAQTTRKKQNGPQRKANRGLFFWAGKKGNIPLQKPATGAGTLECRRKKKKNQPKMTPDP